MSLRAVTVTTGSARGALVLLYEYQSGAIFMGFLLWFGVLLRVQHTRDTTLLSEKSPGSRRSSISKKMRKPVRLQGARHIQQLPLCSTFKLLIRASSIGVVLVRQCGRVCSTINSVPYINKNVFVMFRAKCRAKLRTCCGSVLYAGLLFLRLKEILLLSSQFLPRKVKRENRAGSSRNESDYSRRGTQINFFTASRESQLREFQTSSFSVFLLEKKKLITNRTPFFVDCQFSDYTIEK